MQPPREPDLTTDDETDIVDALVDGTRAWHLRAWADDVLRAATEVAKARDRWEAESLADLLARSMAAARSELDVFAGYLEAPRSITDLYQAHGRALKDLDEQRGALTSRLVHDVAQAFVTAAGPLHWDDLRGRGATSQRPAPPPVSDPDDW